MLKVIIADDERLICRLVQALGDWEAWIWRWQGLRRTDLKPWSL